MCIIHIRGGGADRLRDQRVAPAGPRVSNDIKQFSLLYYFIWCEMKFLSTSECGSLGVQGRVYCMIIYDDGNVHTEAVLYRLTHGLNE